MKQWFMTSLIENIKLISTGRSITYQEKFFNVNANEERVKGENILHQTWINKEKIEKAKRIEEENQKRKKKEKKEERRATTIEFIQKSFQNSSLARLLNPPATRDHKKEIDHSDRKGGIHRSDRKSRINHSDRKGTRRSHHRGHTNNIPMRSSKITTNLQTIDEND